MDTLFKETIQITEFRMYTEIDFLQWSFKIGLHLWINTAIYLLWLNDFLKICFPLVLITVMWWSNVWTWCVIIFYLQRKHPSKIEQYHDITVAASSRQRKTTTTPNKLSANKQAKLVMNFICKGLQPLAIIALTYIKQHLEMTEHESEDQQRESSDEDDFFSRPIYRSLQSPVELDAISLVPQTPWSCCTPSQPLRSSLSSWTHLFLPLLHVNDFLAVLVYFSQPNEAG